MVGKWRLNNFRRLGRLGVRSGGREDSPLRVVAGEVRVADDVPNLDVLNFDVPNHDVLNQERRAVNSIGRRSDCQSRNTPPTRNTKSASQTPAAGERCPWRAKDTPIKEI